MGKTSENGNILREFRFSFIVIIQFKKNRHCTIGRPLLWPGNWKSRIKRGIEFSLYVNATIHHCYRKTILSEVRWKYVLKIVKITAFRVLYSDSSGYNLFEILKNSRHENTCIVVIYYIVTNWYNFQLRFIKNHVYNRT